MTTVQELQSKVQTLTTAELIRFREWLVEYEEQVWDKQIEEDSKAGRFDAMIARAREDTKLGLGIPLNEFLDNA